MDNIQQILLDYDNNNKKYKKMLKKIKYYSYEISELENNKIILYDKNKDKTMEAKFQFIGDYYNEKKIWEWSWSDPGKKTKDITIIKKLFEYGMSISVNYNLNSNYDNMQNMLYSLKYDLINSRFYLLNKIQIDIHLALISALTKHNNLIFKIYKSNNIVIDDFKTVAQKPIIFDIKPKKYNKVNYLFLYDMKNID